MPTPAFARLLNGNHDLPPVLSVAYNNDLTCFSVGLASRGYCIFDTATCEPRHVEDFAGGIGPTHMLGITNYIALVGGGKNPQFPCTRVSMWDTDGSTADSEININKPIIGIRVNEKHIVVVIRGGVAVWSSSRKPIHEAVFETADNPLGLCELAGKILAIPGRTVGHVRLVDTTNGNVSIIPAHSTQLVAIRLSQDGELLATASEKGTIIRVFATSNCAKIAELRRGLDNATIFSLGFSPSGAMLACTSDKGTLHLFDVQPPQADLPPGTPTGSAAGHSRPSTSTAAAASPVVDSFAARARAPSSPVPSSASLATASSAATSSATTAAPSSEGDGKGKWGILGKIPGMPRYFSDVVSWAHAPFYADDVDASWPGQSAGSKTGAGNGAVAGAGGSGSAGESSGTGSGNNGGGAQDGGAKTLLARARPPKGVIGWLQEDVIILIGGGDSAKWEQYFIKKTPDGKRVLERKTFKRILEPLKRRYRDSGM